MARLYERMLGEVLRAVCVCLCECCFLSRQCLRSAPSDSSEELVPSGAVNLWRALSRSRLKKTPFTAMDPESKSDDADREATIMAHFRCKDFTFGRLLAAGSGGAVFTASLAPLSADGHPFPDKMYAVKVRARGALGALSDSVMLKQWLAALMPGLSWHVMCS